MLKNNKKLVEILKQGEAAIIPTDTIYGLVGSALNPKAIEKIYNLKYRNVKKPLIILIGSLKDLDLFKIKLSKNNIKILKKIWPNKTSVILPCPYKKFDYLHCGKNSLAFRWPKDKNLISLIKKTGPLAAPSANPEGLPPAKTIFEARKYFGKKADIYIGGGKLESLPSTLIELKNGKVKVLRNGETKF